MIRLIVILFALVLCGGIMVVSAQTTLQPVPEMVSGRYPVAGSHLLRAEDAMVRKYLLGNPGMLNSMRLAKPSAWGFSVGSTHTWYSVDFTSMTRYPVTSTCRAVGVNCYIFVEDSLWGTRVNQSVVDSVRTAFDLRCPANNTKGIYQMDVDAFGNPPDVDSDPRIILLILNIRDGYNGTGGFVEGFFSSYNETNLVNSNQAEIYFLDANPLDLRVSAQLQEGLSTTAHEFQHMIHYNYDPSEIVFINEGCSLVAEVNCGYPIYDQSGFAGEANHYLFDWRTSDNTMVLNDYSRAARFMTYVRDQVGMGVFRPIVASPLHGIDGMNAGLQTYGTTARFAGLFDDWTVANILNDTTVLRRYGYVYPNLPPVTGRPVYNPNISLRADTVAQLAAEYIVFKAGTDLQATFTVSDPSLELRAVETGPAGKRVVPLTSGVAFQEPGFGTSYTQVAVIITNTSTGTPHTFTYEASGVASVLELKWDTPPSGYYKLVPGDTVCVTFDGVAGGRLDSVKVAMRGVGTIRGFVYDYSGALRPTPLGKRRTGTLTAVTSLYPPYPYPVPWPNWGTAAVPGGITVNAPFVVAFIVGQDSLSPMFSFRTGTDPYHSYTYLHELTSPNWYYLTSGDSMPLWLVRAYVTLTGGDTGVLPVTPTSISLSQNYPNPFNPATNIRYDIPVTAEVVLSVYDPLGRKVTDIVNGIQSAGSRTVQWSPSGIAGGVYFYRLRITPVTQGSGKTVYGSSYILTRKMLLIR